jgi:hypothetical protein
LIHGFPDKSGSSTLTERYATKIRGVLSCYDRVIISGTLPGLCYAEGMERYLRSHGIRLFDYAHFAEPYRERIRENAEAIAQENGLEIEFLRGSGTRKEDRVQAILKERGDAPGLVCIFAAMESCPSFRPWHDKRTGHTSLRGRQAQCLHYYFYFIDADLGLCYLRVPTWAPFRLQFYFNGHNWLARHLSQEGIRFTQIDNCLVDLADFDRAQAVADAFTVEQLHAKLDQFATRFCPVFQDFGVTYHWSVMQAEYSTDIVFRRQEDLRPIYATLSRTAIHAVKPDRIATFLGRKLNGNYQGELGNDFHTRIEGTCIRHHMGSVDMKMYDKYGLVLRLEVCTNDVSFFKHYRKVEHRNAPAEMKWAPMKKTIYSLPPLREVLLAANGRYLAFLSTLDDPSAGVRVVEKISQPIRHEDRNYSGFNLFASADLDLLCALVRGEFNVSGFDNKSLRRVMPGKPSAPRVSRQLKRLRVHGLIRKVGKRYKYYLTQLGRVVLLTALKLRELVVIPSLAQTASA